VTNYKLQIFSHLQWHDIHNKFLKGSSTGYILLRGYTCRHHDAIMAIKKGKQSRYTPWRRLGGDRRYSSYSFTTSALDGVSGQRHAPAELYTREKNSRYPLDRRLGGPQRRSEHRGWRKNPLPLPGIEPRSPGCPVRSQTDWTELLTELSRLAHNGYTVIYYRIRVEGYE
jgi:hypothetical protein